MRLLRKVSHLTNDTFLHYFPVYLEDFFFTLEEVASRATTVIHAAHEKHAMLHGAFLQGRREDPLPQRPGGCQLLRFIGRIFVIRQVYRTGAFLVCCSRRIKLRTCRGKRGQDVCMIWCWGETDVIVLAGMFFET